MKVDENLKEKWERRLERSGFIDVEKKSPMGLFHRAYDIRHKLKQVYYNEAGQFYHETKWPCQELKRFWELHQEGVGHRVISKKMGIGRGKSYWMHKHCKKMFFAWREGKEFSKQYKQATRRDDKFRKNILLFKKRGLRFCEISRRMNVTRSAVLWAYKRAK